MLENNKDYFRLYENTHVLPRFFLVSSLVGLSDREAIARAIRAGEYDPGKVVLVQNKDLPSGVTADCRVKDLPPVTVVSYSMNTIVLTTDAPCHAFLATSEVMYPGWTATIDGVKTVMFEGNLAFRSLYVPAGHHTIVMAYQPWIFIIGGLLSVLTATCCFLWIRRNNRGN